MLDTLCADRELFIELRLGRCRPFLSHDTSPYPQVAGIHLPSGENALSGIVDGRQMSFQIVN
jgi:hypothetical protein